MVPSGVISNANYRFAFRAQVKNKVPTNPITETQMSFAWCPPLRPREHKTSINPDKCKTSANADEESATIPRARNKFHVESHQPPGLYRFYLSRRPSSHEPVSVDIGKNTELSFACAAAAAAATDCIHMHMHFQEIGLAELLLDKKRAEELKNRCSNVYLAAPFLRIWQKVHRPWGW